MKVLTIVLFWMSPVFSETVIAEWDANTEPDLAGYNIYYGTESGNYDQSIDVGNNISWIIDNFVVSAIYYFTVTAYDSSGNESDFGEEVSFFVITGIGEVVLDFKDCDEVKTYNVLGQSVKSDRSQLPSGFYVRRCFVRGKIIWTKSEILVK